MRIKKISNTRAIAGKVVNAVSESTTDAYSCDYINDCNTYSTNELNTGKTWIDGKPIYRKVIDGGATSEGTARYIVLNLGADTMIDYKTIIKGSTQTFVGNQWYSSNIFFSANYSDDNGRLYYDMAGNVFGGNLTIIVEYTKTTD